MTVKKIDDNIIEPLPDMEQAPTKKRGRPKKSSDDLAKERENDVDKVKNLLLTFVRMS